ncbi:MAG: NAD(P)/FAD-dependent oxidoreductase [Gammaproteobacteria bacterium]|jgi:NADH dehydrogenase
MKRIVIVGGGFAGVAAARRLERRIPADWQLVLVSAENFMLYTPLLPEVAGASLLPGHSVAPLRSMLRRTRYYQAQVEEIDLQQRIIRYRSRDLHELSFDHLVLACGKVADIGIAAGMQEQGLPLKTVGDALHIRNQVINRLEEAELEKDPDVRRTLTSFIVVGGGTSGVEVAGAVADFMRAARKNYLRTRVLDTRVIVLESGARLAHEFPAALGEAALKSMRNHGVEVHLNARVKSVSPQGVKTESGDWFRGGNVICTIGTQPNPVLETFDLPTQKGLVSTGPDMSVAGLQGVWAIGDCAAVVNAHDGEPSPPTAQFAVRQGKQVADNIERVIRGKSTRPFSYRPLGQLASIGHRRAIAHVTGLQISGFPAWLLWRAVYLSMLPTFLRKLQVFSEWTLELLFPRDTTQLHLQRTTAQPGAAESGQPAASPASKAASG